MQVPGGWASTHGARLGIVRMGNMGSLPLGPPPAQGVVGVGYSVDLVAVKGWGLNGLIVDYQNWVSSNEI